MLFAQTKNIDIVYLKNGGIIRGIIIEQVPGKSIKIQTADMSVFVYPMDEVSNISTDYSNQQEPLKSRIADKNRNGYIGFSIGPSIPTGKFSSEVDGRAKTGVRLNLVSFGYKITKGFGVSANCFGGYNLRIYSNSDPWMYGGLIIGPMGSIPVSNKIDLDFRPMVGVSVTQFPGASSNIQKPITICYDLSALIRFHIGEGMDIFLNSEYFFSKPEFTIENNGFEFRFEQSISTISYGLGFAYRIN
jgi:hypothetical protein